MSTCSAALGPVQSALRAVFGWQSAADYWFPNVRSLGGAILIMGFVLYPYVYLAARAMFQTQSAALIETARGARREPLAARPRHRAAAGAARDRGGRRAGAARNAQRHRRQRISRRADADAVDLHHLAQPSSLPGAAQIACVMLLAVAALIALERYGRRRQGFTGLDTRPGRRASASR